MVEVYVWMRWKCLCGYGGSVSPDVVVVCVRFWWKCVSGSGGSVCLDAVQVCVGMMEVV